MEADTKSESEANPYLPPRAPANRSGWRKVLQRLFLGIASVAFLLSLLIAWKTFELANQEYLYLWRPHRAFFDIEINGKPVSIGTAIRYGVTIVVAMWFVAVTLLVVSRFFVSKNLKENDNEAELRSN